MNLRLFLKVHAVPLALLAVLTIALFSNTLQNQFIWDDKALITENPFIKNLDNIPFFFTPQYWNNCHPGTKGLYRPLVTSSFALDYSLWNKRVFGYHFVNLVLHTVNVMLVYIMALLIWQRRIRKDGICEILKDDTAWYFSVPFLAALFFSAHPVHTESVAWIKNRSDPMSLAFFLISFILFIPSSKGADSKPVTARLAASVAFFVASILSKENSIILPLILVLCIVSIVPVDRMKKEAIKVTPFFGVASLYFACKAIFFVGNLAPEGVKRIGAYSSLLAVIKTLGYYIAILVFPVSLNIERPFKVPQSIFEPVVIFSLVILFAICLTVVMTFRRSKFPAFALLWVLVTLLPVSNIVYSYGRPIAEQRLYIPSVGFCLILAFVLHRLYNGSQKPRPYLTWKRIGAIACVMCIVAFYAVTTMSYNLDWKDPVTFWAKAAESSAGVNRPIYNFGTECFMAGDYEKAMALFEKASRINKDASTYNMMGNVCYVKGDTDTAILYYEKALGIDPKSTEVYNNLALAYRSLNKNDEAVSIYKKSIRTNPDIPITYHNLAVVYEEAFGEHEKAIGFYKKAIRLGLNTSIVYYNLGVAYDSMGMVEEAMKSYKKAIRLRPGFAEAYNNIAAIYYRQGRQDLAIRYDAKAKEKGVSNEGFFDASRSFIADYAE